MTRSPMLVPPTTRLATLGTVFLLWALALAAMICNARTYGALDLTW